MLESGRNQKWPSWSSCTAFLVWNKWTICIRNAYGLGVWERVNVAARVIYLYSSLRCDAIGHHHHRHQFKIEIITFGSRIRSNPFRMFNFIFVSIVVGRKDEEGKKSETVSKRIASIANVFFATKNRPPTDSDRWIRGGKFWVVNDDHMNGNEKKTDIKVPRPTENLIFSLGLMRQRSIYNK